MVTSTTLTPATATWTEALQFTIPSNVLADTYTANLTHSVL